MCLTFVRKTPKSQNHVEGIKTKSKNLDSFLELRVADLAVAVSVESIEYIQQAQLWE